MAGQPNSDPLDSPTIITPLADPPPDPMPNGIVVPEVIDGHAEVMDDERETKAVEKSESKAADKAYRTLRLEKLNGDAIRISKRFQSEVEIGKLLKGKHYRPLAFCWMRYNKDGLQKSMDLCDKMLEDDTLEHGTRMDYLRERRECCAMMLQMSKLLLALDKMNEAMTPNATKAFPNLPRAFLEPPEDRKQRLPPKLDDLTTLESSS